MTAAKTILVADDDQSVRTVLTQALKRAGYGVNATGDGATLYKWVANGEGDLVITDVLMPGENGIDLIPKIHGRRPDMKVIVMSAQNALTTAVSAVERGAMDFLPKPFDIDQLLETVGNALRQTRVLVRDDKTPQGTTRAHNKTFIVGQSHAMQNIYRTIAHLTNSDLAVLISGESGTGKEIIARALHEFSRRKNGPFVAVNMAAIPKELIESELFGHEKGAFTGAVQKFEGRFAQGAGGTLFLDEIGDMPMEAQTRLLRVLQEGEFTPVGGRKAVKTDVRIVAATHRDMHRLVADGKFRHDLYHRLNVVPIRIPPLRERREDIPALVQHFVLSSGALKVFATEAVAALRDFPWPGNIRELESLVRRLAALHAYDVIELADVQKELSRLAPPAPDSAAELPRAMNDLVTAHFDAHYGHVAAEGLSGLHDLVVSAVEKPLIEWVLSRTEGNQIKAAAALGINRNTLRVKIRQLGIEVRK
ncbi:MAG: nitrogen regulation protein NR(I) [Alphaproteobacteria bacterium]|nr:nitrogen regulation protein NR(I) [Alphaproteobacteria bacterium]